jgi:hypothetical protein
LIYLSLPALNSNGSSCGQCQLIYSTLLAEDDHRAATLTELNVDNGKSADRCQKRGIDTAAWLSFIIEEIANTMELRSQHSVLLTRSGKYFAGAAHPLVC